MNNPLFGRSHAVRTVALTVLLLCLQIFVAQAAPAVAKTIVLHSDPATAFPHEARRAASSSNAATPACSDSHPVGYQMLYARPSDVASRFASLQSTFLADAASAADRMIAESSSAPVRPRFYCGMTEVVMPQTAASYGSTNPLNAIMADLQSLGYKLTTRKYVVWWDGLGRDNTCGEGTFSDDNSASPSTNQNNMGPDYALIYQQPSSTSFCPWTTVLHEMGHTLGAVMRGAPHQTANWHCTDQQDIMCYPDGPGVTMTQTCPGTYKYFDCNKDDYFNPSPPAGSYLATHWNTYNSSWLESAGSPAPSPSPSPSPTPSVSTTPTASPTQTATPSPTPSPGTPSVSFEGPHGDFQRGTSVGLTWTGSDADASYVVRYRSATGRSWFGGFTTWNQQATSATFVGAPGSTYCFSLEALNSAGEASPWTPERCTSIPLDDRSASSNRFQRIGGSNFFQGTASIARVAKARLTWAGISAKKLAVTFQMCPSCRGVDALWNGRLIKRIYLKSNSTRLATVPLVTFSNRTQGTLALVVRSPIVIVDSLGIDQV